MPTTRDLSPVKRKMILEWLENPKYDLYNSLPPEEVSSCIPPDPRPLVSRTAGYSKPPRCQLSICFEAPPHIHDTSFHHILIPNDATPYLGGHHRISGRPLLANGNCSVAGLKEQLQTAMELEWATIPLYLTSLYSIVETATLKSMR